MVKVMLYNHHKYNQHDAQNNEWSCVSIEREINIKM